MANPPVPTNLVALNDGDLNDNANANANAILRHHRVRSVRSNQNIGAGNAILRHHRVRSVRSNQNIGAGNAILRHHRVRSVRSDQNIGAGNAILRHHRVRSVRSNQNIGAGNAVVGVGNAVVLAKLGIIRQAIQRIHRRLDSMETRRLVDRARTINKRIYQELHALEEEFVVVVKHTQGHPNFNPPLIPGVVFETAYNIGDQPPNGLVPKTFAQFGELVPVLDLRRILRGIFWFYNDPSLQVGANTGHANCLINVDRVKRFFEGSVVGWMLLDVAWLLVIK